MLVPGERAQGPVDTCWVWAATAVTEVALAVQEGVRDRLSIEYFDATYRGGGGPGWAGDRGWITDYAAQLTANPVLVPWSNPNASYRDGTRQCLEQERAAVEASAIATDPHYTVARCEARRIPTWRVGTGAAVANVRAELDADRAVFVGFTLPNATARRAFREFWANGSETDVWDPSPWLAADEGGTAFSHAVAWVGYDARDPENRYWVMLNFWGTANGQRPLGTFRMRMDLDYDRPVYRDHPDGPAIAFEALAIEFADHAGHGRKTSGLIRSGVDLDRERRWRPSWTRAPATPAQNGGASRLHGRETQWRHTSRRLTGLPCTTAAAGTAERGPDLEMPAVSIGFLLAFLQRHGVDAVIAGNTGGGLCTLFSSERNRGRPRRRGIGRGGGPRVRGRKPRSQRPALHRARRLHRLRQLRLTPLFLSQRRT